MNPQITSMYPEPTGRNVLKTSPESQKKEDQGIAVELTKSASVDGQYSMAVNDQDHPLELKYLDKKEAWVDCPFCHSRVKTRIEKHAKKEDVGWSAFAVIMSFVQISGLSTRIHTFTHYCSACGDAIAERRPGSRFAQTLERSEIKAHVS